MAIRKPKKEKPKKVRKPKKDQKVKTVPKDKAPKKVKPKKGPVRRIVEKITKEEPLIAEVRLNYFKQGDDFNLFRTDIGDDIPAVLEAHAESLANSAASLRKIKRVIEDRKDGEELEWQADSHMIQIMGPPKLVNKLVKEVEAVVIPSDIPPLQE